MTDIRTAAVWAEALADITPLAQVEGVWTEALVEILSSSVQVEAVWAEVLTTPIKPTGPEVTGTTATASSTYSSQTASLAVDGNPSTYWMSNAVVNGEWLKVAAGSPKTVGSYLVGNGPTPARAPKTFVLQGSVDGSTGWTTVDTKSNEQLWVANEKRLWHLAVATSYQYWRLLFTSADGDSQFVNVGEFVLYEADPASLSTTGLGALPV